MILITGATGYFGKATIDFLLKKGILASNISALVRDIAKADDLKGKGITLKVGNYDDYASLVEAFKGVDKLLLVSGNDIANRSLQQKNVVNAAGEAGVKHILYTSFERKNETETSPIAMVAKGHLDTERYIKTSGLPYTIFRNNLYMDAILLFLGEQVLETGVFFPAGEGKVTFASRNDMAEAAANILTSDGHENKEYWFSGTEKVSFQSIAGILSQISGKTVVYINPSTQIYTDALVRSGVPMEYIGMFTGFAEGIKQGEFDMDKSDLESLLDRKPVSIKEFLAKIYSTKN